MSSEEHKCPICGKPTSTWYGNARKDGLCREHAQMLKEGKLVQCSDCGSYHLVNEECKCKNINTKEQAIKKINCLVCKTNINPFSINKNLPFICSDCRKIMEHNIKELDKNQNVQQYRDYYFNLRSNIYRLYGFEEYIKPNLIKLIAIAQACKVYRNNSSLIDRVELDIKEILKSKENEITKEFQTKQEESKIIELNTKNNRGNIRGKDGHFLDSNKEQTIDDILFDLRLPHAIHTNVPKITERGVTADWYIPVIDRSGIYIEYFGMNKTDYNKNKEEKIELYRKHDLPLIYILPDELEDTQRLTYRIENEYEKFKKELTKQN